MFLTLRRTPTCCFYFSELLTTKAALYAAMHDPYGDWSRYVSGESHCRSFLVILQQSEAHEFVPVGRWSGGHIKWGQSFRIRHITTGRYLYLDEEKGLLLVDAEKANSKMSAFCFRISKVIVCKVVLCIIDCLRLA